MKATISAVIAILFSTFTFAEETPLSLPGISTVTAEELLDLTDAKADLVIVDESSMVDLALMKKLMDAVPREARIVLLGDKDQLASVEAGAVLADICTKPAYALGYSSEFGRILTSVTIGISILPAPHAAA